MIYKIKPAMNLADAIYCEHGFVDLTNPDERKALVKRAEAFWARKDKWWEEELTILPE